MGGKIDKELAIAMRVKGATYAEIADHFGVSWQAVQRMLRYYAHRRRGGDEFLATIPYKGLYAFLFNHDRVTIPQLARVMYKSAHRNNVEVVRRFINGGNAHVPKKAIDRLLAYTGMTYEKLFELREGFKEADDE